MNVGIISLGCAKNRVDSEEVLSYFARNGFQIVSDSAQADILVVNTCGFIEAAKKEAIDTIFDTLKYKKVTVVIGCLVERYYEELKKEIPEVDLFVPIRDYPRFGEMLSSVLKKHEFKGEIRRISVFFRLLLIRLICRYPTDATISAHFALFLLSGDASTLSRLR